MNFGELQQEVALLTKRPEKVSEIKIAINDAIRYYSLAATFSHDLVEDSLNITLTEYAQNITISASFPRFRKIHYLKRPGKSKPLELIDPLHVITSSGCEQLDKWYRSGDKIFFKLSVLSATLDYGYYAYPAALINGTDSHWMLDLMPHVIRSFACAEILYLIGEETEAGKLRSKADAMFLIAKTDLATGDTY